MKKIIALGIACVLFVSLSGCGGAKEEEVVKEAGVKEEEEVKEEKTKDKAEEEAAFIENLGIEINGVELVLPMEKEQFLKESGLTYVSGGDGIENVVTDGNSAFEIVMDENDVDVVGVNVYADGYTEGCKTCNFNIEKTSVIFPGDITINMSEEEVANQYKIFAKGTYRKSLDELAIWMPTLDTETYGTVSVQFGLDKDGKLTDIYFMKYPK